MRVARTCTSGFFDAVTAHRALGAHLHQSFKLTDESLMDRWERGDSAVSCIDKRIDRLDSSLREGAYWHPTY